MFNTKLFESFTVLYRHRNITKAAEELFMTRQALSSSIQRLEAELDATLFLRSNKGLVPTEAADMLYRYSTQMEQLWQSCLAEIHPAGAAQPLRIGLHLIYYSAESLRWFKSISNRVCGANPVLINITNSQESRRLLEEDRADLVITHKPPEGSSLHWENLKDDRAFAIMREDDPLAAKEILDFTADFAGRSLIFLSEEAMREVADILSREQADFSVIGSDRVLLREAILADRSVFIIPEQSMENFLGAGMTARLMTCFPVTNGIYVIFREERRDILRFVEELRSLFGAPAE